MNAADVVGYAYDVDVHCVSCAEKRFSLKELKDGSGLVYDEPESDEKIEVDISPIFAGEDAYRQCGECRGSGECQVICKKCGLEAHDCNRCGGDGEVSLVCGDCGETLIP